jgi:uncharacterized peroxidase-related enzyme
VDEGWGRKAVDFATLSEPGNCREYVAVHHRLGVDAGDRLLDLACGSGLAVELARLRGASCSGIDASARLVAVARDRNLASAGRHQRRGLPGPQTRRSRTRMTGSFLEEPPVSAQVQALYDEDLADGGYVWNVSRLWAHQPDTLKQLFGLMSEAFTPSGLTFRQRGILVTAAASALGDSYCSLAWGGKLGQASDAAVAAGVLNGSDAGLTDQEKAMAAWARKVARDPNATTPADIQALRDSGLDDGQIFAITAFVALRLAFSTINDSLGAQPDAQLAQSLPREVREAVTYGRPVAQASAV